jgi:hypothetical protein
MGTCVGASGTMRAPSRTQGGHIYTGRPTESAPAAAANAAGPGSTCWKWAYAHSGRRHCSPAPLPCAGNRAMSRPHAPPRPPQRAAPRGPTTLPIPRPPIAAPRGHSGGRKSGRSWLAGTVKSFGPHGRFSPPPPALEAAPGLAGRPGLAEDRAGLETGLAGGDPPCPPPPPPPSKPVPRGPLSPRSASVTRTTTFVPSLASVDATTTPRHWRRNPTGRQRRQVTAWEARSAAWPSRAAWVSDLCPSQCRADGCTLTATPVPRKEPKAQRKNNNLEIKNKPLYNNNRERQIDVCIGVLMNEKTSYSCVSGAYQLKVTRHQGNRVSA